METKNVGLMQNKTFLALLVLGIFIFLGLLSIIFSFSYFFAVAISLGFLSIILFFKDPLLLLCSLIIIRMSLDYSSNFLYFKIAENVSLSLSQLVGIAIALLGGMLLIFKRKNLKNFSLLLPFLIMILWGGFTLFFSVSPKESFQEIVRIFDLLVVSALAFTSITSKKDFKKLLLAILISAFLPIIFGVYQFIFNIGFQDNSVSIPRIFGTFSHPNVFSMYLFGIISLAFLYIFTVAENKKARFFCGLFVLVNTIILLLTYTRIAWIALLFFIGVLGVMRFRKLIIPLIIIPILLFAFSPEFQKRISETINPSADSSIVWRENLWKDAINKTIADKDTLTGSGINTFPIISQSARGIALGSNESHNDFVKFFIEGGLLGLGVFIIYLGTIISILLKQKKLNRKNPKLALVFEILLVMFLAIIISSLSDNIFKNTPLQWIFWITLGGSLALAKKHHFLHKKMS